MAPLSIASCARTLPVLLLTSACAYTPSPALPSAETDVARLDELPPLEGSTGPQRPREFERRVGDVWVHRFSGAYRSEPLTLREEVLAKSGQIFVVDYILTDEKGSTHLRVDLTERTERVIHVQKIIEGEAHPATLADYEAMIEKTVFVPQKNDGKVAEKTETCLVGKSELECDIADYQVQVASGPAMLSVARSEELKRDVAGEVTAVDGTILYSAELMEMRRGREVPDASPGTVALNEWDPFVDD